MQYLAINFPPISEVLNWKPIFGGGTAIAFNKVGVITLLATVITLALFWMAGRQKKLVPVGVQNFVEWSVEFIDNSIIRDAMGPEGRSWGPYLTALFFFIFIANVFEVIPFFQMPATARMAVPAPLAIAVWVTFVVLGVKKQGFRYFKDAVVPPGVPVYVLFILVPIEILSTFFVRPFALAIRLFGNMLAGHLLLLTFTVLSEALFIKSIGLIILPLPFAMLTALTGYEIFVSALQAFIFTTLTAVYLGESLHGSH
ncbi:MAG: F0F1 ATP synthase subunit A [Actinomycetota bacterium]|nr:F0F1 ATP synthase subunit A [Actinomycetota bacterium]